jgi:hypothetical protein
VSCCAGTVRSSARDRLVHQLCDGLGTRTARRRAPRLQPDNIWSSVRSFHEIARTPIQAGISMADEDARLTTSGVLHAGVRGARAAARPSDRPPRRLYARRDAVRDAHRRIMPFGCDRSSSPVAARRADSWIRAVAPDVPAHLASAIERLLALDPADRFHHART